MKYARPFRYDHDKEAPFQDALKKRVDAYFDAAGGNRKATPLMWTKIALFTATYFVLWASIAFVPHSLPVTLAYLAAFAFSSMILAFNVSHDAVHQTLSRKKGINDFLFSTTFNLVGPNAYLWRVRHNNAHHFFVNIPGSDMDIEGTDLIRVAPHVKWRPMHRYQHLYCGLLYAVFTLHWIFVKDFMIYRMNTFGNVTGLHHPKWRFAELIAWKLLYVGYIIGIPMIMLPYSASTILLAFVGFHLFMSFFLLLTFASSHIAMESHYVVQGPDGEIPHSFLEHQLLTSIDYHPRSRALGFFLGGFNSHVAHHMFPNICSVHYADLSRIIRDTAKEYGLPYHELSLGGILLSHFRLMKTLGQGPASGDRFVVGPRPNPPIPIRAHEREVALTERVAVNV